jgi:hypothetical protein
MRINRRLGCCPRSHCRSSFSTLRPPSFGFKGCYYEAGKGRKERMNRQSKKENGNEESERRLWKAKMKIRRGRRMEMYKCIDLRRFAGSQKFRMVDIKSHAKLSPLV